MVWGQSAVQIKPSLHMLEPECQSSPQTRLVWKEHRLQDMPHTSPTCCMQHPLASALDWPCQLVSAHGAGLWARSGLDLNLACRTNQAWVLHAAHGTDWLHMLFMVCAGSRCQSGMCYMQWVDLRPTGSTAGQVIGLLGLNPAHRMYLSHPCIRKHDLSKRNYTWSTSKKQMPPLINKPITAALSLYD